MRRPLRKTSLGLLTALLLGSAVRAGTVPQGFQETTVWSGLTSPTAIRFASDGRVFVAEKRGRIKVFSSLTDPTPDLFVDLSTNVYNYWDKGLLGLALDPGFPTSPYVYVLYTYDYDPNTPGIPAPRWGDACPTPPGDTDDGCVVNGRLSRLQINASNQLVGGEQVLLENNWCNQYPSHGIGDLVFDSAGALLASAGDGASFDFVDYGQGGGGPGSPTPENPCGDPPSGRGGDQSSPTAQGGALRAQDLRTAADPVTYDGSILRIHPTTGAAWPDNPLIGGSTGDDRTIAYGLRNPFRMTTRPGTNEVWVGDVGWSNWEEIERIVSPSDATVENFGWPCYEGSGRQDGYDDFDLDMCENLYAAGAGAVQAPYYAFEHGVDVTPGGDTCGTGSSAISGLAFYPSGGTFPATYNGALFFADYGRNCIYVIRAGGGGNPDLATRAVFDLGASSPVDLRVGPGGDLFYVDINGGAIRRIRYTVNNTPPTAVIEASSTAGPLPLVVQFDGSGSFDPDPGTTLTYQWDLDGDGQYDDSTAVGPSRTYNTAGPVTVRLRVTDNQTATGTASVAIFPGNAPPTATVLAPAPSTAWRVGDSIAFSGSGNDPETGALPAAALHWDVVLHHCPGGTGECHAHVIQQFHGMAQGSFVAPDHEWFSYLEFRLLVTDGVGLTGQASVSIDPASVLLSYDTLPTGLSLVVGGVTEATPFTRSAIVGSLNSVSAPASQSQGGESYAWRSWSNGGPRSQEILAGSQPASYVASYTNEKILVVAPHPGDDVSMAAGVISRALTNGIAVRTVFLTNADAGGGAALGLARQAEAVDAAVAGLGMTEDDLIFLGYPESYLATISTTVPGPAGFTTPWGQSVTYGNRGLGGMDYHTYRFGSPAAYTRANLIADLADLLESLEPTHIVVSSQADRDFDHQATYAALIEALEVVHVSSPAYAPTVHTTVVRAQPATVPPAWPDPASPTTPFTDPSGFSLMAVAWAERESLDVPLAMQATPLAANPKSAALEEYASLGGAAGFLGRFVHKDEFFWVESPLDPNHPPHVDAGSDQSAIEGAEVQLQGGGSSDPDGSALLYQWRQTGGTTVALSDTSAPDPTFTAPGNGSEVLSFELLVGDGSFLSLPDAVSVRVHPSNNAPPVANAGPDRNVGEGALVQLDGSSSFDPDGDPMTYQWTETSGPYVQLSDATASLPTFIAPAGLTQNVSAIFRLVASDGVLASAPDQATVTIAWSPNTAPLSTASASSQNTSTGQLASKAIDRVIAGYPVDYSKEWATNGQGTGAWIQLNWSRPYLVDHVTLYDRPNTNDRVMGGTLLFSDSSTATVGALTNNGAGVTVNFTQRVITSVRFTVTSVSATTENVGLAEFEVYRKQSQTDVDQDGWSVVEGDCDDADRLAYPGAAEIPYNGKNDDCNAATSEDDLDGDGVLFATDCNDANPLVRAQPLEISPLMVDRNGDAARLGWPAITGQAGSETAYDIVSGDLAELLADGGYARATCFVSMTHATTWDDFRAAPLPLGLYYLVRGKNSCGNGTLGNALIVPDPRDALDASGPCP